MALERSLILAPLAGPALHLDRRAAQRGTRCMPPCHRQGQASRPLPRTASPFDRRRPGPADSAPSLIRVANAAAIAPGHGAPDPACGRPAAFRQTQLPLHFADGPNAPVARSGPRQGPCATQTSAKVRLYSCYSKGGVLAPVGVIPKHLVLPAICVVRVRRLYLDYPR